MISKKMEEAIGRGSVIRSMFEEGCRLAEKIGPQNVYDFSLGNPSIPSPDEIRMAAIDILQNEEPTKLHGYMNSAGFEEVRCAIAKHINLRHNINITAKNIVMTVGATCGLCIVFHSILDPGDEVITLAPFFSEYRNYVEGNGGKLVVVPTQDQTFQPDLKKLEKAITPNTKAVIINSPNNPTGVVYSPDTIQSIALLLQKKSREMGRAIVLVSDEPYREIIYREETIVPYVLNYYENSFIVYSFSKSFSLPGERIGYVAFSNHIPNQELVAQGLSMAIRSLGYVNAPALFQKVIGKCIDVPVNVKEYKANMEALFSHLKKIGFSCVKPEGAFYLFVKSPNPNDNEFAESAKKYNILVVPGSFFGYPGYFRVTYCVSNDKIINSFPQWTKLAEEYSLRTEQQ
jgi:aspartate aminotransferase